MSFLLVLAIAATSVEGVVTSDHQPLPGCTVILEQAPGIRLTAYTDVKGAYRIAAAGVGAARLSVELAGFEKSERSIYVAEGENVQAIEDLPLSTITETITLACGIPCSESEPESYWNLPSCADFHFDTALIESIQRGDASAVELGRRRQDQGLTYGQKHRLAAALLRHGNDGAYWRELHEHARNAVRFLHTDWEPSEEFASWCEARKLKPEEYSALAMDALRYVAEDSRSRPLLLEALDTREPMLIAAAITGLAGQHDESSLPAIEKALARVGEEASALAVLLVDFGSEAADQLAFRTLSETDREVFDDLRASENER